MTSGRYLSLTIAGKAELALYPSEVTGHAAIAALYEFTVLAQSPTLHDDCASWLGHGACLTIGANTSTPQLIHGVVTQVLANTMDETSQAYTYELILRPFAQYLTLNQDCRCYVEQDVRQITQHLLKANGFTPYDIRALAGIAYPRLAYTAQYNESSYQFLSRLWAQHGIYHVFDWTQASTLLRLQAHGTVKTADIGQFPLLLNDEGGDMPHCRQWQPQTQLVCGRYSSCVYTPKHPTSPLTASCDIIDSSRAIHGSEDSYDPGHFATTVDLGYFNQVRAEAAALEADHITASAHDILGLTPGVHLQLMPLNSAAGEAPQAIYVTQLQYHAHDHSGFERAHRHSQDKPYGVTVNFRAQRVEQPFAIDPKRYPKPSIRHPQTAKVCGPDEHDVYSSGACEVKVRLHWDKYSQQMAELPWVRCLQSVAGDEFGMQFMPRVGEEVNIEYLFGDPDKPIVTGSMTNPNHPMPLAPEQSGLKTQLQGSNSEGHHLIFDDTIGQEALQLHAAGDLNIEVLGNETHTVKGNDTTTIAHGDAKHIIEQGRYQITAGEQLSLVCGNSEIRLSPTEIIIQSDVVNFDGQPIAIAETTKSIPSSTLFASVLQKLD